MGEDRIVSIAPSIPNLHQRIDHILESVWAPPEGRTPNPDDRALIHAASEFRKLQKLVAALERARGDERCAGFRMTERAMARLDARWNALFEFIYRTPAAGLDGVALKLRMLTDPHVGI